MASGMKVPGTGPRIRIAALVILLLLTLIVTAAVVAWLLLDADQIRKQLETDLSDTLSLEVKVGQPLQFGLLRGPSVTLNDLNLSKQGQTVATVESVRVEFATSALLTGNVRPDEVHINQPELTVVRASSGELNIYRSESGALDALVLQRLNVKGARINVLDQATEKKWQIGQCHLDLHTIRHDGGALAQALESLAAEGEVQCDSLSEGRFKATGLMAKLRGNNGLFEFDPVNAITFGGTLSGRIEADLASRSPAISLDGRLTEFDFGKFMAMLNPDQVASGKIDLTVNLNSQGTRWQAFRQNASGLFSLSSGELTFDGFNLDDELEDYAETQRFNLVDVGAVFLAGPVGLVATRGYAFTGLIEGSEGSTTIDQMVSEWVVEDGVAQAQDVAFRTPENRLALSGALDFVDYSFENLQVAVIDPEGCAVIKQQVTGPFHDPEIDKPNVLVAVTGPMLNLIQRGVQAITNTDCEVFYSGSLPHP